MWFSDSGEPLISPCELKMSARLNQYTFDRIKEDNWPEQAKTALCEMCDCAYIGMSGADGKTSGK